MTSSTENTISLFAALNHVSTVADCLVTSIVAAIRIGGFKITVLALGNEGGKCVFGDTAFKAMKEKYK